MQDLLSFILMSVTMMSCAMARKRLVVMGPSLNFEQTSTILRFHETHQSNG